MKKLIPILRSNSKTMKLVVTYDIKTPKRLNKIAKIMKSFGERVQKSVFECELDELMARSMKEKIAEIIQPVDSVRIYFLCESCKSKIEKFGENHPDLAQDEDFIFI